MTYVDELNAKSFAPAKPPPPKPLNSERGSARWHLLNTFVVRHMRRVSPTAVCVWMVLYRHAEPDGLVRMVSIERIAKMTGLTERTVYRALDELKVRKLMAQVARGNKQSGPSIYRLLAVARVPKASKTTISQGDRNSTLQGDTRVRHTDI